jgi:non-heme chloroperoxidase
MTTSNTPSPSPKTNDEDLAEQARPGHGIPSQDPDLSAQFALNTEETQRETESVLKGGGMVVGAAIGAVVGAMVGDPVGVLVGASLGAVVGVLGGVVASSADAATQTALSTQSGSDEDVCLHIEDSGGEGPPVVLIHGWPLSSKAWSPQVSVLQDAGYRVVTYDRRGFGQSAKPDSDYSYDTLADDLLSVMDQCGLKKVTLVGFSMGGGEVARYIARYGDSRLHSVVFAAAVPPCLMKKTDNPEGPLTSEKARASRLALEHDRDAFFNEFTRVFFSANGVLLVDETQRQDAIAMCQLSAQHAALACMDAFQKTDFREDLEKITVPTLVIHGDADAIVPIEGSGERINRAIGHSKMVRVSGAPHGLNVSHAKVFNDALLAFLKS